MDRPEMLDTGEKRAAMADERRGIKSTIHFPRCARRKIPDFHSEGRTVEGAFSRRDSSRVFGSVFRGPNDRPCFIPSRGTALGLSRRAPFDERRAYTAPGRSRVNQGIILGQALPGPGVRFYPAPE